MKSVRPKSEHRLSAIEEIKNGEPLLNVSKKYNIPISTLHRDKQMLFNQGNLPINVTHKIRKRGEDFDDRLRRTICEILNGKSQNESAKLHDIPKATIWRVMKKVDSSLLKTSVPIDPYSAEMDKIMEGCTAYSKRKIKTEEGTEEQGVFPDEPDNTLKMEQCTEDESCEIIDTTEMATLNIESGSLNPPKRKRKQILKKEVVLS